ncbi:hypothetical protein B0J15DRAFT_503913 [Fusarium solani]|uniref:Uncharacterized protein n=1 Tax=Fusarium solani TaxID=169388 RepID=A0A9P9JWG4_FUSSL|nr:uncharacterized protein B0J15DRAFT_503913 [Fusarium solani]KAH7235110.1 hypothetical protein B0J15DRAFT_503913 [Fusarium solani]
MEESSDHPEPKDRGRTPSSGIQQQIGRGRSPVPGRARSPRPKPTESESVRPMEVGVSAGTGGDLSGSLSRTTFPTIVSSTFSNPQETMVNPDSDTDPTDNDDSNSEDSERDHNGKKGRSRDEGGDSSRCKEDDSTQYNEFQRMQESTSQTSFPVSENSIECDCFNESLQDIVACLGRSNTGWVSIDCLGRRWISESKESKIRTTMVVSFSEFPDRAEELRRDLQMAMKDNGLPVEFVQGKVTRYVANPFGVLEPQTPLVCGSSCAPHGDQGGGTIGGFITIDGDPDPNAVYAVTNHHVVVEDDYDEEKIPWTTEQYIESHLGLTEQQCEDLADLGLDRYDRSGIHAILSCLDSLKPTPQRTYGDDRKSYLIDLAGQVLNYWNKTHTGDQIGQQRRRQMRQSIRQRLSQFQVPGQRTQHRETYQSAITNNGLMDFQTHLLEDMRAFLNLHCYELQILFSEIRRLSAERGRDGMAIFRNVILIRRLWTKPPGLSRIIEHPANEDLGFAIRNVKGLLNVTGETPMPQSDTEQRRQQLIHLENHSKSPSRLIGTVWASGGIVGDHIWRPGSSLPVNEDWALIKLFRKDNQEHQNNAPEFQNKFNNILRPGFPENQFAGVRELPDPIRIDVTKKGRTTDLTAGVVNGARSVIKLDRGLDSAFVIVSKPPIEQFFSAKGDSGSWIMDRAGRLVGMVWGGREMFVPARQNKVIWGDLAGYRSQDFEVQDVTYFTPASYFFRWIETSFKKGMRTFGHELPDDFEGRVRLFG